MFFCCSVSVIGAVIISMILLFHAFFIGQIFIALFDDSASTRDKDSRRSLV